MRRGAQVHYVHGRGAHLPFRRPVEIDLRAGYARAVAALRDLCFEAVPGEVRCYEIRTVEDLMVRLRELLEAGDKALVVQAMAVSDYTAPAQPGKISSDQDELLLRLERAPKVIAHLKGWAPHIVQVGFKLLSAVSREQLYATGLASGRAYNSDLTIANDRQDITADRHPVLAIWPDGASEYIAHDMPRRVVDLLEESLARRGVSRNQGAPGEEAT
jgi:phosphopantothenoylcysteine synthetase/decarboxylase